MPKQTGRMRGYTDCSYHSEMVGKPKMACGHVHRMSALRRGTKAAEVALSHYRVRLVVADLGLECPTILLGQLVAREAAH